jgi:hypothetical protein
VHEWEEIEQTIVGWQWRCQRCGAIIHRTGARDEVQEPKPDDLIRPQNVKKKQYMTCEEFAVYRVMES